MNAIEAARALPSRAVPDRVVLTRPIPALQRETVVTLDGPGCIRHIALVSKDTRREVKPSRDMILRIYFDGAEIPHVECPFGDFFGVMHGEGWYPLDTHWLSVLSWGGYNCYFPMPFARDARIEFEGGPRGGHIYLQVDWHRYPCDVLETPLRFCARWRREAPTESYGQQYMLLDTTARGLLAGFVYGVRLFDNEDRWSHGGAENIYIDGEGAHPAYIRGIGGEDTFGVGYGGNHAVPLTHHYASMPYYVQEDIGEARPAQRVVGYRFFEQDAIQFEESLQMRFGCMVNDISSTTYWYQDRPVRPFFRMPDWGFLLDQGRAMPTPGLPRGSCDIPAPEAGQWWICGPFACADESSFAAPRPPEEEWVPAVDYDGGHAPNSRWLTEGARQRSRNRARWFSVPAHHGFVDFNHWLQPVGRGVAVHESGLAYARCQLECPVDGMVRLRLTFDDALALRVNDGPLTSLGRHMAFRTVELEKPLRRGRNTILIKHSNTTGLNHGGWAFNFQAFTATGESLIPTIGKEV